MARKQGDDPRPTFLPTRLPPAPTGDAEAKPREPEDERYLDIPTFLRAPARQPRAARADQEQARLSPEEIQRRLARRRAMERDAGEKEAICRHCFQPEDSYGIS